MHGYIYIYTYAYIYVHIHICIHICICTYVYIYLHNSCMCACTTVQQLPCHGSYCELILSLARTSCRLSFPPALLPLVELAALLLARCPTSSLKKSVQIHASSWRGRHCSVAQATSDHPRCAGLIQFVYGSHSRMATDLTLDKIYFRSHFCGFFPQRVRNRLNGWVNDR